MFCGKIIFTTTAEAYMNKTDKIFGVISKIISRTGTYFMFLFLFVSFVAKLIIPDQTISYNISLFAYVLLFSFIMSLIDFVLCFKQLGNFFARVTVHYVLSLTDFIVVLCLLSKITSGGKQVLALSLFFTVVYAVVMTVYCICRSARLRRENKNKEYKNEFTPDNT